MLVTKDKYELPIIVEESPTELARKCGVTATAVMSNALKAERGEVIYGRYRRVLIEDDTEEV
jgi:hypothetical protein